MRSWPGYERREACDEIERLEHDCARAVLPVAAQPEDHASILGQRQALERASIPTRVRLQASDLKVGGSSPSGRAKGCLARNFA